MVDENKIKIEIAEKLASKVAEIAIKEQQEENSLFKDLIDELCNINKRLSIILVMSLGITIVTVLWIIVLLKH